MSQINRLYFGRFGFEPCQCFRPILFLNFFSSRGYTQRRRTSANEYLIEFDLELLALIKLTKSFIYKSS